MHSRKIKLILNRFYILATWKNLDYVVLFVWISTSVKRDEFTENEECSGSSEGADGGREERGVYAAPWWCGNWIMVPTNDDQWVASHGKIKTEIL